ncbi:hypothetical protein TVAG_061670 [Trichomonas vaginalis G3]|uniref:Uncharacterized protein n=1 Tax=Trichomonas vaginalis (strain ATCC PRA-98 / G3) TaxID=412133 RepID=A2E7T2_TRIV3|nr:hypothetical protein TVAGG3_0239530 [Trichomonas vaginalis G3]EAY11263.1 hypothetical protein TVAG_061670 [Trichomonas vaginalis G3]KAI5553218.1 hypothetical protein TVAGG3_0239530 [Trichomonas vaginalis G3]|eukprot:XP_001323486.1 hypothetical protein [Trichomonas vaginalis G3]
MGIQDNPPKNGNFYFPSDYFAALTAYYRGDDATQGTLRINNPDMPRPDFVAIPPPGYIDYTLVPLVWTFQSPKIDRNNVTYRAYINGTLLEPDSRFPYGGYQDMGDWSTTDGARFTRKVGFDTNWHSEGMSNPYLPYPGTKIRVEVESNGYSWEYETLVVDCEHPPTPVPTPGITPVESPALTPIPSPSSIETPAPMPISNPIQSPTASPKNDPLTSSGNVSSQNGKNANQKKTTKLGLEVGIPAAVIVLAAIGVGIFILISKGLIGHHPSAPSDEEGIDV